MIRAASVGDAGVIAAIYNHYVLNSWATFEEKEIVPEEMSRRIAAVVERSLPWLAAEEEGRLVGYSYAGPWKDRSAYRFSAESTIYLEPEAKGRGLGVELYGALLDSLRRGPCHSVIGIIALPNEASVALHERLGFKKVAHLREVGWKFGRRIDVGYWQVLL
jgi:L-amino acid N-acyltransferase YncA